MYGAPEHTYKENLPAIIQNDAVRSALAVWSTLP